MYSGLEFTKYSGRIMGAHQKIDRVARRHLTKLFGSKQVFPAIRHILQFEGRNGPDGIKVKSPAKDEPWHYYSPFSDDNDKFLALISDHYNHLVEFLKAGNKERTAFEAAWLAHALVDGLTPAHHYPYEEKLTELRGGAGIETRTTYKEKLLMPGANRREKMKNNWKMWGPSGLISSHILFEFGVSGIIKPLTFSDAVPTAADLKGMLELGPIEWFKRASREIAALEIFDNYLEKGWNGKLALDVRQKLAPTIIRTVSLTWYMALADAGLVSKSAKPVAEAKVIKPKARKTR